MMRLLLLGFFVAAILFLIGALTSLYRFLTRSRLFPQLPRLWKPDRTRTMIFGGLLLASLLGLFALGLASGSDDQQEAEVRDPSLYPSAPAGRPKPPITMAKGEERVLPPAVTATTAPPAPTTTQPAPVTTSTTVPAPTTTAAAPVTTSTTTTLSAPTTTQPAPTTTQPAPSTTTTTAPPTPPTTTAAPKPKPPQKVQKPYWTVCFSSYKTMASAKKDTSALKAKGLAARIYKVSIKGKGMWHRVCVGRFPSMKAANAQAERWRKAGLVKGPFPYQVR